MRLIDADRLQDIMKNVEQYFREFGFADGSIPLEICNMVVEAVLNKSPTVDAVPVVHGEWLGEGDGYADGYPVLDVWYCSKCNYCIDDGTDNPDNLPNYCPNCGAKMDGGVE